MNSYQELARDWMSRQPICDPDREIQLARDRTLVVEAFEIIQGLLWELEESKADKERPRTAYVVHADSGGVYAFDGVTNRPLSRLDGTKR